LFAYTGAGGWARRGRLACGKVDANLIRFPDHLV
jgi:hypothetical protein